jgi:hypothetical protein
MNTIPALSNGTFGYSARRRYRLPVIFLSHHLTVAQRPYIRHLKSARISRVKCHHYPIRQAFRLRSSHRQTKPPESAARDMTPIMLFQLKYHLPSSHPTSTEREIKQGYITFRILKWSLGFMCRLILNLSRLSWKSFVKETRNYRI